MNTEDAIKKIRAIPRLRDRYDKRATIIEISQMVRRWREGAGESVEKLALKAGGSPEEIDLIMSGQGDQYPSIESLIKVADACGQRLILSDTQKSITISSKNDRE